MVMGATECPSPIWTASAIFRAVIHESCWPIDLGTGGYNTSDRSVAERMPKMKLDGYAKNV